MIEAVLGLATWAYSYNKRSSESPMLPDVAQADAIRHGPVSEYIAPVGGAPQPV